MDKILDAASVLSVLIVGFLLGRHYAMNQEEHRGEWVERIKAWALYLLALSVLVAGYFGYSDVKSVVRCQSKINILASRSDTALLTLADTLESSTDLEARRVAFTAWVNELKKVNAERNALLRTDCS